MSLFNSNKLKFLRKYLQKLDSKRNVAVAKNNLIFEVFKIMSHLFFDALIGRIELNIF